MYLCAQNHDLKRGGTFETAKAGTFHSVTAGTSIPLFTKYASIRFDFQNYYVPLQQISTQKCQIRMNKMVINPLNLLKSESSKFSQESAKKRIKTGQKRLESTHHQKVVLMQQSDYQRITRFSTLFLPYPCKYLIIN